MVETRLLSPAKINLGLWVGERSPDGLHHLATLFAKISFGDEMVLSLEEGAGSEKTKPELIFDNQLAFNRAEFDRVSSGPGLADNLVTRAWDLFPVPAGLARLTVRKQISIGGGLGGGSSNAGTILRWIAGKNGREFSPEDFRKIRQLGSDIPFFCLAGRAAWMEGCGEELEPVPIAPAWGVLALVPQMVPTGWAYGRLKRPLQPGPISKNWFDPGLKRELLALVREPGWPNRSFAWQNDFEPVVYNRYPALGRLRDGFREAGATVSMLSGSGASVFALADSPKQQGEIIRALRAVTDPTQVKLVLFKIG